MIHIENINDLIIFLKDNNFKFDDNCWIKDYTIYLPENNISKSKLKIYIQKDRCFFYQISDKYGKYQEFDIISKIDILKYMKYLECFSREQKLKNIIV